MKIVDMTLLDVAYVCNHAMADEVQQWAALGMTVEQAQRAIVAMQGISYAAVADDGTPLAVGGFTRVRDGVWQAFMATTPECWDREGAAVSEACRQLCDDLLASGQCHRIEIVALASRVRAGKWYQRALGATLECVAAKWFPDGSDAAIYARVS